MTTPTPPDAAYALIHPDGTLSWKTLDEKTEVDKLVGGYHGPTSATGTNLGPVGAGGLTGVLRLRAGDLCLTEHYDANPTAQRVITELSEGYVAQRWGGVVAFVEFDRDPATGEVGFPRPMSRYWANRINSFFAPAAAPGNE